MPSVTLYQTYVCGRKRLLYITQCYSNPVYSGHALAVLRQPMPPPASLKPLSSSSKWQKLQTLHTHTRARAHTHTHTRAHTHTHTHTRTHTHTHLFKAATFLLHRATDFQPPMGDNSRQVLLCSECTAIIAEKWLLACITQKIMQLYGL